jgi:hypothetical protein
MELHFKTKDHPEANGRQPKNGESKWTPHFPLENGDVLYLSMGEHSRNTMFGMMIAEAKDSGEGEPRVVPFPTFVAGFDSRGSVSMAVPQTFGEAVKLWGEKVVCCEPHEYDNRTTEENAVWLLCRLHVRERLKHIKKKWRRSGSQQYMLMEVIGDGPRIEGNDSWLCQYSDWPTFLGEAFGDMEPEQIANIRFTFLEMDDIEFEEYCVEHGIDREG